MKRAYTIALLSIVGGVLIHLMVLLVIRIEVPSPRSPIPLQAPVSFLGNLSRQAGSLVLENAALNDSAPLFMPTRWNPVSEMSAVASLKEATEIFQPFAPVLALQADQPDPPLPVSFRESPAAPELPDGPAFVLSRYGRQPAHQDVARSPGPACSLQRLDRMETRRQFDLSQAMRQQAPGPLWSPVQMFIQLKYGLPAGLPLVGRSSGFRDWDRSLQEYFSRLDFYRHLQDGYYQIWIYP